MSFIRKHQNKLWGVAATVLFHATILLVLANEGKQEIASSKEIPAELFLPIDVINEILETPPQQPLVEAKNETESTTQNNEASNSKSVETPLPPEITNATEIIDTVPLEKKSKALEALTKTTVISTPDTVAKVLSETVQKRDSLDRKRAKYLADREFYKKNYKTIYNLKKVYAFAKMAQTMKQQLDSQLVNVTDKSERRRLIKEMEKQVFANFESAARNMSTSQGKLLLKLFSRQIGQTGYDVVKEYKGAIPAAFWQGIAILFRQNLKSKYDSINEDAQLEKIVKKYENKELGY